MEDAEGVQVLHAVGNVGRQRYPQRLRQRLRRPPQQELLQRTTLHVLREGVQLSLMDAHAHKPETIQSSLIVTNNHA